MYQKIAGTKDILPQETPLWQKIEEISRNIFSLYNYKEIRPPLIEEAALFNRSLGQTSEIIQKQMFLINSGGDACGGQGRTAYALRPEGTASVARGYIENNLDKTAGFVKLYYIGPMFRLERPQKGRLRQFHHIGAEAIGSTDPNLDVEIISLADSLLKGFSIDNYKIKINSLGCVNDKKELIDDLGKELKQESNALCSDCQIRLNTNTLRVLDCKNVSCQAVVSKLNIKKSYLCPECRAHFSSVKEGLDELKINYEISPYLVRGLDYYTGAVFEITHPNLGAQDALGAGGRYNNLINELGGPNIGAAGFAFGMERTLLALSTDIQAQEKNNLVYIITMGEKAKKEGLKLLSALRQAGITSDTDYENKSLKGALRKANDLSARFVLIIGDDELKKGTVTLKNMISGEQREIRQDSLITELQKI